MKAKGQISWWQLYLMIFAALDGTAFIVIPRVTSLVAGRDAWVATLLGLAFALLSGIINANLALRFPTQTLIIYLQTLLGKFLGKVLGAIYIAVLFFITFVTLKDAASLYTTVLLHATPRAVLSAFTVSLIAWLVWTGVENIGRLTEVLAPIAVAGIILALIFSAKFMNPGLLLPIFGYGPLQALSGSRYALSFLGMGFIILLLVPNVNAKEMVTRSTFLGILLGGILTLLMVLGCTSMFGPNETRRMLWPGLELAKMVHAGEFLERVEAVFLITWIIGAFLKIGIFLYCVAIGIADWVGLPDYRPLIFVLSAILFVSDIFPLHFISFVPLIDKWVGNFAFIFTSIIPALLLMLAIITGKQEGKK